MTVRSVFSLYYSAEHCQKMLRIDHKATPPIVRSSLYTINEAVLSAAKVWCTYIYRVN
jgi:hypothetical protein